jgi:hypothetical protein
MILEISKKKMISLAAIAVLFFVSIALVDSFALETNTDRPGMDYSNFDLASANPSLCEQACDGDPNCLAFTYVKPGVQGANARCWLKNGIPTAYPATCCDSGVKGTTTGAVNISSTGSFLRRQPDVGGSITPSPAQVDLTGVWSCDDGGIYYIRQFGTIVWWYGEHDPNTPDWSNVMRGTISGNTINADWTDVPKGSIMQYGTLNLNIESNDRISAVSKTGGFAGSVWTRQIASGMQFATPIQLPGTQ